MAAPYRAVVDEEGRIVIPEELRRRLQLAPGSGVEVRESAGLIWLRQETPAAGDEAAADAAAALAHDAEAARRADLELIRQSKGVIPTPRPMSEDFDEEIEEAIAEAMAERYPWTLRQ